MAETTPTQVRWPLVPTILVALAVLTMIGLGVWQWQRKGEKEALIATFERNAAMSSEVAFPAMPPVPDAVLFRRTTIACLEPVAWRAVVGRTVEGATGYRFIAACRTGAEGPGALVDMGVKPEPAPNPAWKGGAVQGIITLSPDQPSLFDRLTGRAAPVPAMLVASDPAPGLSRSAPPDPRDLPNNHLAYAVQWWIFAAAAALIYWLALRRRTVAQGGGAAS